jgi:hypothetical protein
MGRKSNGPERIAFHEAGHAVAAYLLAREFSVVTIVRRGDTLGHCALLRLSDFHPDRESDQRTLAHLEEYMLMLYAGVASEYLHTARRGWSTAHTDVLAARHLATNACGSNEEADIFCKLMFVRSKNLLRPAQNWAGLQALAATLCTAQTLSFAQAKEVIEEGMASEPVCMECGSLAAFIEPKVKGFVCLDHAQ